MGGLKMKYYLEINNRLIKESNSRGLLIRTAKKMLNSKVLNAKIYCTSDKCLDLEIDWIETDEKPEVQWEKKKDFTAKFRIEKKEWELFKENCKDNNEKPSDILRSMIRSWNINHHR